LKNINKHTFLYKNAQYLYRLNSLFTDIYIIAPTCNREKGA
jgi:hypothetical protein